MRATCHYIIYPNDTRKRVQFFRYFKNESDSLMCQRASSFYNIHELFHLPNPSGRTMALGSTQPLTGMSTRNLKKETWG
jgi:hypothetical protein